MLSSDPTSDPTSDSALLFDIDGTLVDSTHHHAVAWQHAFDHHGVHPPMWRIHRAVGMGGDTLVPHDAGDEVEESLGEDLRTAWSQTRQEQPPAAAQGRRW